MLFHRARNGWWAASKVVQLTQGLPRGWVSPAQSEQNCPPFMSLQVICGSWIFSNGFIFLMDIPAFPKAGCYSYPTPGHCSMSKHMDLLWTNNTDCLNLSTWPLSSPIPIKISVVGNHNCKGTFADVTSPPTPPDIKSFSLGWRRSSEDCLPRSLLLVPCQNVLTELHFGIWTALGSQCRFSSATAIHYCFYHGMCLRALLTTSHNVPFMRYHRRHCF